MRKITLLILLVFTITVQGQDKLLSSIQQTYWAGVWNNSIATNYEYDSNNNLISETNFEWDVANFWKVKEKVIYTYNASNKVVQELGQIWNATTNSFENDYKVSCTYTNGKITEQIVESANGLLWVNDYKLVVAYNSNNLIESAIEYSWDAANWVNSYRTTLTYNTNNKISMDLYEEWNNSQWINSDRAFYTYNINNKITIEERFNWDEINNIWENDYRNEYQLDTFGNRINNSYFSNSYRYRDASTYDTSILMANLAHPFQDKTGLDYILEDFPYINKVLIDYHFYYNTFTGLYENGRRTTYNYNSTITLGTNQYEIANTTITVFPNPTTSILNIDFSNAVTIDKVVVVDATGKTVLQQNQNTSQINVENLTAGLYIIEAFSGNEKFTSKFVKK